MILEESDPTKEFFNALAAEQEAGLAATYCPSTTCWTYSDGKCVLKVFVKNKFTRIITNDDLKTMTWKTMTWKYQLKFDIFLFLPNLRPLP